MSRISLLFRSFAVLLFAALFVSEPAWALQCDGSELPDNAIFRGKVTRVVNRNTWFNHLIDGLRIRIGLPPGPPDALVATFTVKSSWRGVTTSWVKVTSNEFGVGHEYLVYAYGPVHDLHADRCSRTREFLGTNDEYLATLPELPLTEGVLPEALPIGAIVVVGALAALIVFWERRRRRAG